VIIYAVTNKQTNKQGKKVPNQKLKTPIAFCVKHHQEGLNRANSWDNFVKKATFSLTAPLKERLHIVAESLEDDYDVTIKGKTRPNTLKQDQTFA
jgi:hypothetical protein